MSLLCITLLGLIAAASLYLGLYTLSAITLVCAAIVLYDVAYPVEE